MGYVTRYPTEQDESWPEYDLAKCEDTEQDQPIDGIKLEVSAPSIWSPFPDSPPVASFRWAATAGHGHRDV